MVRSRPLLKSFLVLLAVVVLAVVTRTLWLPWFGSVLVHDEQPFKADVAVVPAGGFTGQRLEKATELVKAGWVPAILVSGPPYYDIHECDLAIPMMVRRGYPASWFIPLPNESLSTRQEAWDVLRELKRRQVKQFLMVTSNYHTARARRIYEAVERAMGGGPPFRVVAAPDQYFTPQSWWKNREGQKTVFLEWWKGIAAFVGD